MRDIPVRLLVAPSDVRSSYHLAVIRLKDQDPCLHKNIFKYLRSLGIGVQLHYQPVHLNPYYRRLGFCVGDFPESELYATNAISLPLYPGLTHKDQTIICNHLSGLF